MRTTALIVLSCIAVASGARAQPAPQPVAGLTAPQPYPPAYPPAPYYPAYPPAPYPAPPYYPAAPYVDPQAIYIYEMQRRSPGIALVLELLLPGAGSLYGGHTAGALATWSMTVAGIVLALGSGGGEGQHRSDADAAAVYLGVGLFIGGRIDGLVDAYGSTVEHNQTLAQQLGLPPGLAVVPAPIRVGDRVAWGPALALRF